MRSGLCVPAFSDDTSADFCTPTTIVPETGVTVDEREEGEGEKKLEGHNLQGVGSGQVSETLATAICQSAGWPGR